MKVHELIKLLEGYDRDLPVTLWNSDEAEAEELSADEMRVKDDTYRPESTPDETKGPHLRLGWKHWYP